MEKNIDLTNSLKLTKFFFIACFLTKIVPQSGERPLMCNLSARLIIPIKYVFCDVLATTHGTRRYGVAVGVAPTPLLCAVLLKHNCFFGLSCAVLNKNNTEIDTGVSSFA